MGFETEADRAALMDPAAFGTAASWTVGAGAPVAVPGIWTDPHRGVAQGEEIGVSLSAPMLTIFAEQLPVGASQGDTLVAKGATFTVLDLEPEGSGLVRVILQRV